MCVCVVRLWNCVVFIIPFIIINRIIILLLSLNYGIKIWYLLEDIHILSIINKKTIEITIEIIYEILPRITQWSLTIVNRFQENGT